jgi:hypothetical protein
MFIAWRDLVFAKGRFGLMGRVIALVAFLMVLLNGLVAGLLHNTVSGIAQLPKWQEATYGPAATPESIAASSWWWRRSSSARSSWSGPFSARRRSGC